MSKEKVFGLLHNWNKKLMYAKTDEERSDGHALNLGPFYSCLRGWKNDFWALDIRNGGTFLRTKPRQPIYFVQVELRMGDYARGGSVSIDGFKLPNGLEPEACQNAFRNCANDTFWDCVDDHEVRNQNALGRKKKREKFIYFSKEKKVEHEEEGLEISLNFDEIEENLKRVTLELMRPDIYEVEAEFYGTNEIRYLVNSEDSKIHSGHQTFITKLIFKAIDKNNRVITHSVPYYNFRVNDIPVYDTLMADGEKAIADLLDILKAPIQKNGIFSSILPPMMFGTLIHEAVGHYVEADSMMEDEEGDRTNLFFERIGEVVAPEFLSIYDDPTMPDLLGSYAYDEDAVKAEKVLLIEDGVLKNFLYSRESAGYFEVKSNGHARLEGSNAPTARMSNLVIESKNEVSYEELVENLKKECKDKKKPYGLIFETARGGETWPEACVFGAFPAQTFRIYPNGKKQRVRGIYIIGTPQDAVMKIAQTSNRYQNNPGLCGAESGIIRVSETAPDALLRDVEVNRVPNSEYEEVQDFVIK